MRYQLLKCQKYNSTKAERIFAECLKRQYIKFRSKVKIGGREVDFLIDKYAIDINGHEQDAKKNEMLVKEGYIPIHFNNREINSSLNLKQYEFNKFS